MSLPTTFFCFYSNFTPLLRSKCKNQKTIDMRKTLLNALKHGSGTIFILLAMMLGGSLQAWGWGYRTKANGSWGSCGGSFSNQTFYTTPGGSTTSLYVNVSEHSSAIESFKVYQHDDCTGQRMEVSFSSAISCVVRTTAKWIDNGLYSNYTIVIPEGKIYVTPAGGSAIEMTKGDGFVYTANVSFPTETLTFSLTGDDPSAAISTQENMPSAGKPSSVTLNYSGLSSSINHAKITYNLYTNAVTVEPLRYFSAGEYIYFVNGTNYDYSGGYIGDRWIFSDSYAGIKLTMSDETTQYAWFEYDASASGGTAAGEVGAVYKARIGTAGYCRKFVITRSNTYDPSQDPTTISADWKHITSDLTYDATHVTYNTVTNTTAGTGWTGNYTNYCDEPNVTTTSAPSVKGTTTATCTGTYTRETGECTPTGGGIAYRTAGGSYSYQSGTVSAGAISASLTSLTAKTTYYYKAYVEISGTKVYGSEHSFTTDCYDGVDKAALSSAVESVCLGSATALGVTGSGVVGGVYTYQWYYNSSEDTSGATAIPGATSSSYTPAVIGANYYYCGIAADGGYCEVASEFSKLITIYAKPTVTATPSSTTNYAPVALTASGADVNTWSVVVSSGTSLNHYLYSKTASSAKFKGTVNDRSDATYTITATTANSCSSTATVTVSANTDNCN